MDEAVFSEWALKICLTILIVFLGFIVWHLGKESKAGKFGTFILFLVLGLGVFGFIFKNVGVKVQIGLYFLFNIGILGIKLVVFCVFCFRQIAVCHWVL